MKSSTNISLLASFATIKSLSDEKKYRSPYQILQEFIGYVIRADLIHSFSAIEMKTLLNKHFSFQIPEAVVRTAVKNMNGVALCNGIYTVEMSQICEDTLFQEKKKEADSYSISIINEISKYISDKSPGIPVNEESLLQELICFLVDDQLSPTNQYMDFISEFILKNEKDVKIQDGLNKIREGSILYIGLSHNINEVGSISKPLTLYLGTEVLFSLVGYNGKVFQQLANDFIDQVKLANSKANKRISLCYFSEIKREIEEFFGMAGSIVEGKTQQWLDKPAMKAITQGCQTEADVIVKEADFFKKLQIVFGIQEDPHDSYYDEKYFTSNLESLEYEDEEDEEDKKKKKEVSLKLVSHINKLRDGKHPQFNLDAGHLIVTNTKVTLYISKEQMDIIKNEEGMESICDFAVSLDRITCLLWYKLGSGFANSTYPLSVNALLKARVVLSSSVAQKANRAFLDVKEQYKAGEISEEQVAARIVALRKKPSLPEELRGDDIERDMDFSPESLSRFEEQYKNVQDSLKEKDEIIESIKAISGKTLSEKEATIASQKETIKEKEEENIKLQEELDIYRRKETAIEKKKEKQKAIWRFAWSIIWKILIMAALVVLAVLIEKRFDSPVPMYIIGAVELLGVVSTIWIAIKKDWKKYLGRDQEPKNKDQHWHNTKAEKRDLFF